MKIQLSKQQRQKAQKLVKRTKWFGFVFIVLVTVNYFGAHVSDNINSFVQFVDAEEDLIISELPNADIDETGQIARVDFYSWYGLDELDTLETEYAQVREILGLTQLEEKAGPGKCLGGDEVKNFKWKDGQHFECKSFQYQPNGWVEEYLNKDEAQCVRGVTIPGLQLISNGWLMFGFFWFLIYLFIGIQLIADAFMEAIEVITAQVKVVEYEDKNGNIVKFEKAVWNPTIANLSLMALGSSAPEILLAVSEVLGRLGKPAGELGPSTIVGSAAFNLLFISAVCIPSIEEVKKIDDLGVFMVTSIFSLFAYIWMFLCLTVITPGYVTTTEAYITLSFFVLLLVLAYGADRYRAGQRKRMESEEEEKEEERERARAVKKKYLRDMAKEYGENTVIEVAQGNDSAATRLVPEKTQGDIVANYQAYLDRGDLDKTTAKELHDALQPDSLLERFAYRKENQIARAKDFLEIKGVMGQIENVVEVAHRNELVGFKCLHYSVTENSKEVEVVVVKKVSTEIEFAIRTVADTAKEGTDFTPINRVVQMKKNEKEKVFKIEIVDNEQPDPDTEFFVELYEPSTTTEPPKLPGDDTVTKVTILDNDNPGTLCFEETQLDVSKDAEEIEVTVCRADGADGQVKCIVRTEACETTQGLAANLEAAVAGKHYEAIKGQTVVFEHGETEQTVSVKIIRQEKAEKPTEGDNVRTAINDENKDEDGESDEEEGPSDCMFRVVLDKPPGEVAKLSRKNVAFVTIRFTGMEDDEKEQRLRQKLIEYFISNRDPTWLEQFKNALLLGPTIDSDENTEVDTVELSEAIMHFISIFWKLIFAVVPPFKWGGGWPAFIVSLTFIGVVTVIVGQAAEMFGCVCGIKDSVTAITFVALGTSLPDTFASMSAAKSSPTADAAIGNVTGSNSVNVFLGLGLPWAIAANYQESRGKWFQTPPGDLSYSVVLFVLCSLLGFLTLAVRRVLCGGELGLGDKRTAGYASSAFLVFLWVLYIVLSIIRSQGAIPMDTDMSKYILTYPVPGVLST